MMKIRSILTGIAISLSLAGMAQSQYDGAPVNRSANETSTDNVEVRRNKYPRSDNDWENFDVLHINRLPSAANFMGYPTKELALQGDKSQSPYFQSLNGTWKFHFVPRSDERPMDFFQKGYDVSGWDDIKVPSNWELQGFGYPFYVGSGYGIKKNPPLIAVENSPVGSYRRTFTIPAHWNKRQIILYFGGVASAFYVWVNGEKVGYSQDSKTPSEFDITPYVKQGENEIAVQVFKFSDGYYLEDQDYWRFAGIQRVPSANTIPFSKSLIISSVISPSSCAMYFFSTCFFGESILCANSPSFVIIRSPSVSLSNLPAGNKPGR